MSRAAVVERPLDLAALVAEVATPAAGAIVTFIGAVRDSNDARAVAGIEYSAYQEMAAREMAAVVTEASRAFGGVAVVAEHRIGSLAVGDASVMIAASHAHRAEALAAVTFVIDEIKRRVPIWKREHYVDGTREWVHAGSSRAERTGGGLP